MLSAEAALKRRDDSMFYSASCPVCHVGTVNFTRTDVLAASEIGDLCGEILAQLAEEYYVTVGDITGPRRFKRLSEPRYRAMFQMRYGLGMPLKAIGSVLGGRDHSTIIYGLNQINEAGEYVPRDRRPLAVE